MVLRNRMFRVEPYPTLKTSNRQIPSLKSLRVLQQMILMLVSTLFPPYAQQVLHNNEHPLQLILKPGAQQGQLWKSESQQVVHPPMNQNTYEL